MRLSHFDAGPVDAVAMMLGANETAGADFAANLPLLLDWKQAGYPAAPMVVLGPPPRTDSVETSVLAGLRSATAGR